jgi:hypothetical protein
LPLLHFGLGVAMYQIYNRNENKTELENAEKELQKAKRLIKEQKLEDHLSQQLNEINELLQILNPSLRNYPDILFSSMISFFERINKKPAQQTYNLNNAKFGGGFAGDGGTQTGGTFHEGSSKQNLQAHPQTPVYNDIICTQCDHPNLNNSKFCIKCGTKLASST